MREEPPEEEPAGVSDTSMDTSDGTSDEPVNPPEPPEGYPHDHIVYCHGEPVELVGATHERREKNGSKFNVWTVQYSWWDPEKEGQRGVREESITYFTAVGGLKNIYKALLDLPERRVQGREHME